MMIQITWSSIYLVAIYPVIDHFFFFAVTFGFSVPTYS